MANLIVTRFLRSSDSARTQSAVDIRTPRFMKSGGRDELIGRVEGAPRLPKSPARASMSAKLNALIGASSRLSRTSRQGVSYHWDQSQRAIVKVHYFGHGGGGAKALRAHGRYIARDATSPEEAAHHEPKQAALERSEADGPHHEKSAAGARFYDASGHDVDGAKRLDEWAKADKRHFRLIIAAENGAAIGDLPAYIREIMRRAEAALGTRLQWIAVDHWDTDNPHTHVVLRGVRDDGRDLLIPKDYIKHGFRNGARDIATQRLGERTREDARLALHREVRAHRLTWLDNLIEAQLGDGSRISIAGLASPNANPRIAEALKARALELKRLGLAVETRRNQLELVDGWREALKSMEQHLDIRKSVVRARTKSGQQLAPAPGLAKLTSKTRNLGLEH